MTDILTVGNALIDLLVTISPDNPYCRVDPVKHELCVKAGEKILAENVGFVLGGGACRVAISAARFGHSSSVYSEIGEDELAERIKNTLQKEGVGIEHLTQVKKMTSFTIGLNFQKERTLFTHHVESPHEFDFSNAHSSWIYLASLGKPWQHAYDAVVSYKKRTGAKLACNPGQSQFVLGRESYLPTLSHADVLFVNKQEAQLIADTSLDEPKDLLLLLQQLGPKIVVITDGRHGSYVRDEAGNSFSLGIFETEVIERTGAGDAYAAGFLAALLEEKSVQEAMMWGTVNAAAVVQEFGGLSGLLTKEKLRVMLSNEQLPKVVTI